MKQLLNPRMRNYRANLYYAGESAVAGGSAYYHAGAPIYNPMVVPYAKAKKAIIPTIWMPVSNPVWRMLTSPAKV